MAQSYYGLPQQYPTSLLGEEDVPAGLLPSKAANLVKGCSVANKAVRTSSGNIQASSSAIFQIPSGGGYLKPHSVYLTGTLVMQMAAAATTFRFSGPRQAIASATAVGAGDNKGVHSASALINRLTVSNGTQQLSQIASYNAFMDIINTHAASDDFIVNDQGVFAFGGVTRTTAAAPTLGERTINFAIPLWSSVWTSETALPLWLLKNPLTIEIVTSAISDAFVVTGAGASITSYEIQNAQVMYSEISVPSDLKSAIMDRLNAGAVWKQHMNSCYVIQTASTAGLAFNVGINCSSVTGVLVADRQPSGGPGAIAATGDLVLNGFSNARFLYDSRVQNNFDYNNEAITYAELNRTMGSLYDANVTSCLAKNPAPAAGFTPYHDYCLSKFAYAVSSDCVQDSSVGFSGQPCQTLTIQTFNNTAANSPNFPYVNEAQLDGRQKIMAILFNEALLISADGSCSLVR